MIEFSLKFSENTWSLFEDLKTKSYVHGEYEAFKVNDPKPRDIHKATVRDRLVHHALYRTLYRHFDRKFIYDSYSCRVGKGTHKAMDRFRNFARKVSRNNTKTCWVLKCDIRKFFANIDHRILDSILAKHIDDKNARWLLKQVVDSFYSTREDVGLPLGNLTSQLLVNVYMNEFDHFVKRELKAKYYIRYADDFVFFHEDRKYLVNLLPKISEFLENKLKLSLHPNKVSIATVASGVDFLGWVHFPKHRTLRSVTKWRMLRKIEHECTPKTLASYKGLLSHGDTYKLLREVERLSK